MAETFITQCPHCSTSFRVKEAQLAVANGSVRCGACLQVFSARNHVVPAKPAAARTSPEAPAKTPEQQRSTEPEPRATAKPRQQVSEPLPPADPVKAKPSSSGFEADQDDDADFMFADDPDEDEEFVFQDRDDEGDPRVGDSELGELSDTFLSLNKTDPLNVQPDPFQRETESLDREMLEDPDSPDESWAESILDELEREEQTQEKPEPAAQFKSNEPSRPRQRKPRPDDSFGAIPEQEPQPQPRTGSQASELVRQLDHEIDLDYKVEERLARWRLLGGLAMLVLLVTLAGQLAWLQKDTYAKMDQWRGLYATVCDVIGCTLPAQEDLDQIRASNVLVRDHKALSDVKMLDAVLINRAPFKQAFPVLIIQYTDVNGDLVADQSFAPEEYLRGEMTGSKLMPKNTRIYVSIPLSDPGSRAVNYQLLLAHS